MTYMLVIWMTSGEHAETAKALIVMKTAVCRTFFGHQSSSPETAARSATEPKSPLVTFMLIAGELRGTALMEARTKDARTARKMRRKKML